jgi:hypothetical protein
MSSLSSPGLPPPSPFVAYLAASCARSRDLQQLLALLSCDADVFGSVAALPLITDEEYDSNSDHSKQNDAFLSDDDKRWLLCAVSAWALDSRPDSDGSDGSDGSSNQIITACLQSADVLNDVCAVPLLSLQVQ